MFISHFPFGFSLGHFQALSVVDSSITPLGRYCSPNCGKDQGDKHDVWCLHIVSLLGVAQAEFDQHQPDVVVGSSRGGAVAVNIDSGDTPDSD